MTPRATDWSADVVKTLLIRYRDLETQALLTDVATALRALRRGL